MSLTPSKSSFRFDEALLQANLADALKPMCRTWGGRGNETKQVCIDRILEGLDSPVRVQKALASLGKKEQAILAMLKRHGGIAEVGILESALRAYGHLDTVKEGPRPRRHRNELFDDLKELARRGYLLLAEPDRSGLSSFSFVSASPSVRVFADGRLLSQVGAAVEVHALPLAPVAQPPALSARTPAHVILDLATVSQALAATKRLGITQKGTIRIPDMRRFTKHLEWGEAPSFDGHVFPHIVTAMIVTWMTCGWLQHDEDALVLSVEPDESMEQSLQERVLNLVGGFLKQHAWCELSGSADYHRNDARRMRSAVFHAFRALPDPACFYSVPAFVEALYDRVGVVFTSGHRSLRREPWWSWNVDNEEYATAWAEWEKEYRPAWVEHEAVFVEAVLSTWMYWLGLVELGTLADGALAFRLSAMGRQVVFHDAMAHRDPLPTDCHAAWVVQPNYDVIVYLNAVSASQLAFLEQHAERCETQTHTAPYRLTRESVYHGFECGTTVEDLLSTLRAGAQSDLPQNVIHDIHEWAGRREEMTIIPEARVIVYPNRQARDEAVRNGLVGQAVSDTYVVMKMEASAQAAARVRKTFERQPARIVDYAAPPVRCLRAREDNTLILAKKTADLITTQQLGRFAEPLDATHWRLTAGSLAQSRKAGVRAAGLLGFLEARVIGDVPALMEVTIRNALGKRSVIEAATAYVLHIKDAKLHRAIAESSYLESYVLDVPGPDTIIVSLERLDEFKAILADLGIRFGTYAPHEERPDWQQTLRDAMYHQRRMQRY
jgi:hypothetical protein